LLQPSAKKNNHGSGKLLNCTEAQLSQSQRPPDSTKTVQSLSATKHILSILFQKKKQIKQINIKNMQRYLRPSSWKEKHWKKKATQLQHSALPPNCDAVFSQKLREEKIQKAKISVAKEKPKIKELRQYLNESSWAL